MQSKRIMYINESDQNGNMKKKEKVINCIDSILSTNNLRNLDVKMTVVALVYV
jgi:hypothetical protein